MAAKDTVMSDEQIREITGAYYKECKDKRLMVDTKECCLRASKAQAEITWDKAVREVVECINPLLKIEIRSTSSFWELWKAKLKEWGIE